MLEDGIGGLSTDKIVKSLKVLGKSGDIKNILETLDRTDEIDDALQKVGKTGTGVIEKLKDGFTGLAGVLGISTKALAGLSISIAAVSLAFAGWKLYQNYIQDLVDKAREAGDAWSKTNDTLDAQSDKIRELRTSLDQGTLSEQEAYAAKSELYEIQKSLIDTYGKQAEGIDLVNGSLEKEIENVKELSAVQASTFLNENDKGIKKAENEMKKSREMILGRLGYVSTSDMKVLRDAMSEYSDFIKFDNDGGVSSDGSVKLTFTGDATQAEEVLNQFMNDLRARKDEFSDVNLFEGLMSGVSSKINEASAVLENYQDIYEQAKQAQLVGDLDSAGNIRKYDYGKDSKSAAQWASEYAEAIKKYNAALANGDTSAIEAARTEFNNIDAAVSSLVDGSMSAFSDQFGDIKEQLNEVAVAEYDFVKTLDGANKGLVDAIKAANIDDVTLLSSLNDADLDAGEEAFRKLMDIAVESGAVAEGEYEKLIAILVGLGIVSGQTTEEIAENATIATKSYDELAQSVSAAKSEMETLSGAINEQGYSGNISPETYDALIAKSSDYAACIEYQNGALQLNTEKANALFEAKNKLTIAEIELQKVADAKKWQENAKAIADLESEYGSLTDIQRTELDNLRKENSAIESNIQGYNVQIAALEDLTSAYTKWKNASEANNSDTMYGDMAAALEDIKAAQESGKTGIGNVVYQAAIELLVPDRQNVSDYMATLERYITEDATGLNNFVTDMLSADLMTQVGNRVELAAGVTMDKICEKLTIKPELAKSMFNALEMYEGWDFDWGEAKVDVDTTELEQVEARIAELKAQIEAMKTGDESVDIPIGVDMEKLESDLAEAEEKRNELLGTSGADGENTVTYTVNANTEPAQEALQTIKDKLDEIEAKLKDVAKKTIGTFGANAALGVLEDVYDKLVQINKYKITDKSFTVTQNVVTTGDKRYGSISSTDQGAKENSAHAAVASGTKYATKGTALLGDEYSPDGSPKPELVITDGAAYIAGQNGPEFVNLEQGDQVLTADETRKVLRGNPNIRRNLIPAFATGAGGYAAGSLAEQMYLDGKIKAVSTPSSSTSYKPNLYTTNVVPNTGGIKTNNYTAPNYAKSQVGAVVSGGGTQSSVSKPSGSSGGGSGGSSSSGSSSSSSSSKQEKSQFEKDYEYHQHLLAMEQESYENYIEWLENAYKDAYEKGQIELEDFYRYEEEVFEGRKELFQDALEDIEHKIASLEREPGNESQIINYYNQLISMVDNQLAEARARGLNDDDEYVQELLEQKWDYADEIKDIQEEITENAMDAVDDLVEYRIDMLKQDIENEKDAISDKLGALKDFYDEQKQMLQDVRDEEKYLEEQSEKRKSVDDIRAEMDMLRFDDSAKSQKRLLELQEELREAEKELSDFEKDHALESTTDLLDKMYEQQESQIQSEIDELDARLNDPEALYNQALRDIQNNTLALYEEMVRYNAKYGSGNSQDITDMWNAADESLDAYLMTYGQAYKNIILSNLTGESTNGPKVPEIIPDINNEPDNITEAPVSDAVSVNDGVVVTPNGNRYHMLGNNGSPFFNGSLPEFWKDSSGIGGQFMSHLFEGFVNNFGNIKRTNQPTQITTGDIVIQGNADGKTVSEIRRAQRENVDYMLREFIKLNR